MPTINLADDGAPPDADPPETSTPMKTTLESGKRHSKKKLNLSKIEGTHLIFDMRDQQEKARKSVELEDQAAVPDRTPSEVRDPGGVLPHGLPATLPDRPEKNKTPTVSKDSTPEAPKRDNKHPHEADDITEVPDEDKPAEPPKKKKKKKKNKDSKEAASSQKDGDGGARPSTSMVEPGNAGGEATLVPTSTGVLAEGTKAPKKKKKPKKDAELKKFQLEQREAKAKEMSKIKHRELQREQDFWGVQNY